MKNTYCIIMAGGIGSRFWPLSTSETPKQFLDILGVGKTLLQLTYERYKNICSADHVFVVTNAAYRHHVLEQLPLLKENQVLCEPFRRNTAPCIAYAAERIFSLDPHAVMIASPADHLIIEQNEFENIMHIAIEQSRYSDSLVTIGIKPSRPDTGYGYIQFRENPEGYNDIVKKVKTFTEKPNKELAKKFIGSGDFCWNSGMFVWTVQSILDALKKHLPEVYKLFEKGRGIYGTEEESSFISTTYQYCPNISVDYGIMEKAGNVFMVLADFSWSDLGTWNSLYAHLKKDEHNNTLSGKKIMIYDSNNCIVNVPHNKLAILQGLQEFIIVDRADALLICKREQEQRIRHFVNEAKLKKWI